MTNSKAIDPSRPSAFRDQFKVARSLFKGRLWLGLVAGVAIVAGLTFNWSWLVAAGVAPLLLSALPCIAMCALGLCMTQMSGKGAVLSTSSDPASIAIPMPPPGLNGNDVLEAHASGDSVYKVE